MIGIVDYDIGNLRSVQKALQHVGGDATFVRSPREIAEADGLVLPGVGAFGDCVRCLADSGMWDAVLAWAKSGRPFFGICVGYQMLFESSAEAPGRPGLGLFAGEVKRFSGTGGLKVPQIGWNSLQLTQPAHPLWRSLAPEPYVFFVHSYFPASERTDVVIAQTTYGETFASGAALGNVAGVQFHPEKSQDTGLAVLRNFVESLPPEANGV